MVTNLSVKSLKSRNVQSKSYDKKMKNQLRTVRSIIKPKSRSRSRTKILESRSNTPNTHNQSLSYDADRSPLSASGIYIQTIEQTDKEEMSRQRQKEEKNRSQIKKHMREAADLQLYREGIQRLSKRLATHIGLPETTPPESIDHFSGILNV